MLDLCSTRTYSLQQARRQLQAAVDDLQRKHDAATLISDELGREVVVQVIHKSQHVF